MRSIRAKSLLIDLFFTSISLSHGNDARPVVARRMGYDHQMPREQTQSDEPRFAISEPVVPEGDARPGKHMLCILKAEAMLGEVLSVLFVVPLVFHSISKPIVLLFVVTLKMEKECKN